MLVYYLLLFRAAVFMKLTAEIFIAFFLTCVRELVFSLLLMTAVVNKFLIPELFAGNIKNHAVRFVIAVEDALTSRYPVHLASEDILCKKSRDSTLPQTFVILAPFRSQPWRTAVFAPYAL